MGLTFAQDLAILAAIGQAIVKDEAAYVAGQPVVTDQIIKNAGTLKVTFQKTTTAQPFNWWQEFTGLIFGGGGTGVYKLPSFTEHVGGQLIKFDVEFDTTAAAAALAAAAAANPSPPPAF